MSKRARKAWSGGKRPILSAVDNAFVDHAEACAECKQHPTVMCATGRELHEAVMRQYQPTAKLIRFERVESDTPSGDPRP